MAIGSFFELAHSSSSYASFVQSAMQQSPARALPLRPRTQTAASLPAS